MAHTSHRMRGHARSMRQRPTRGEDRIWSWLRGRRCAGFKFKRQVPIGRYIVDFYCAELRLVIEIDGAQHGTPSLSEYDGRRSRELMQRGLRVVRIANDLIIRDWRQVCELFDAIVRECIATLPGREHL